ncbi:hypothetical protein LOZ36_004356 [Ophidiomyces ophidiicola]|nr:hypothetical protein LOZ36_004356 [Ophidiomyces ophidiicola]
MPFNTASVTAAIAPTAVKTWCSHNFGGRPPRQKPTHSLSYHAGIEVTRQFLYYASHHTVEQFQSFTSRRVISPHWVKQSNIVIPAEHLVSSGHLIVAELGPEGVDRVGGKTWWQWRGDNVALYAEWIEMRSDYVERKNLSHKCKRIILYIHGGAYFFGSVDTHRYQLQRHARKLKARVFARPEEIIFAGDSSGGGMVASILIILRDQRMPLPAGAIMISPWLDLTHSFPSMSEIGVDDYLPAYGFMQRPSMSWPPPNADEAGVVTKCASRILQAIDSPPITDSTTSVDERAIEEFFIRQATATTHAGHLEPLPQHNPASFGNNALNHMHSDHLLTIRMDGVLVELKDQIHMYTTNDMLSHPLVSPVLQPSLGGLPPLLIISGGGEMLRDEQIYFAHKAADPAAYPPGEKYLTRHDPDRKIVGMYKPTYVQLQVWDHLCHVAPTLSFTKPAKYMYRSIAQFAAWVLSRAQEASIAIPDWSSSSSADLGFPGGQEQSSTHQQTFRTVGKAGDPLPPFHHHMIRQLVDGHGNIHPLPDKSQLPALRMPPDEIGEPKVGPVRRWISAKEEWDSKYIKLKRKIMKKRVEELVLGIGELAPGEIPPPTSAAARRGVSIRQVRRPTKKSRALAFWNSIGNRHDEAELRHSGEYLGRFRSPIPRPASETRVVTDVGQSNESERDISEKRSLDRSLSTGSSKYTHSLPLNGYVAKEHNIIEVPDPLRQPTTAAPEVKVDSPPNPAYVPPRSPLRQLSSRRHHHPVRPDEGASTRAIRHAQGVADPVPLMYESGDSMEWQTPCESTTALPARRDVGRVRTRSGLAPTDAWIGDNQDGVNPSKSKRRIATPAEDAAFGHQRPVPQEKYSDNHLPISAVRSAGPNHRDSGTGQSFITAQGFSKPFHGGRELADELNSTGLGVPSETEPFPPFPESVTAVSRSKFVSNADADSVDAESVHSITVSEKKFDPGRHWRMH